MIWQFLKWTIRLILGAIVIGGMSACTMLGLNYASLETDNRPAPTPEITLPFDAAFARETLERELYGPWPENLPVSASEPCNSTSIRLAVARCPDFRASLKKRFAIRIGPTVCDEDGPSPTRNKSKTESICGASQQTDRYP